jgi:hypothetical protein
VDTWFRDSKFKPNGPKQSDMSTFGAALAAKKQGGKFTCFLGIIGSIVFSLLLGVAGRTKWQLLKMFFLSENMKAEQNQVSTIATLGPILKSQLS